MTAKTPRFRVYTFIPLPCVGARGAGMHGASRLALPRLRVRVFSPLAKLGPLRAPRGGCRALSEDFRVPFKGSFRGFLNGSFKGSFERLTA